MIGLYELLCNPTTYKCNSLSNRALITDMIIISIIFFHWFELETVIKLIKTIYWIDSLYALKWNTSHSCFCQYTFTCTCRLALRHIRAIMAMIVGFTTTYAISQCLSPLKVWVRIPLRRGVIDTTLSYVIKFFSDATFKKYFSYIVAGGGNRSTRRKPLTCRIYCLSYIYNCDIIRWLTYIPWQNVL